MDESRLFGSVFDGEWHVVDLTHELTAIAHAKRETIILLDKPVELLADGVVEENAGCPASGAVQYILEVSRRCMHVDE